MNRARAADMWTALNIHSLFSLPFPSPGTRTTPLPPPRTKPAELQPEGRQRGGDAKLFGTAQKWEFCQGIAIYLTRSNTLDKATFFFPLCEMLLGCSWLAPRQELQTHLRERKWPGLRPPGPRGLGFNKEKHQGLGKKPWGETKGWGDLYA